MLESKSKELQSRVASLKLKLKIKSLQEENETLRAQIEMLRRERNELRAENEKLSTERESLIEEVVELSELQREKNKFPGSEVGVGYIDDHLHDTIFVASKRRELFHRQDCVYAETFLGTSNCIEYSSHEEAVAAGRKPCKTCKA